MRSRNWQLDQYPSPPVRTREPGGELGIRSVGSNINNDYISNQEAKVMKLFQYQQDQTYLQTKITDCMLLMSRRGSRFMNCGMRRLIPLSASIINFINFINLKSSESSLHWVAPPPRAARMSSGSDPWTWAELTEEHIWTVHWLYRTRILAVRSVGHHPPLCILSRALLHPAKTAKMRACYCKRTSHTTNSPEDALIHMGTFY